MEILAESGITVCAVRTKRVRLAIIWASTLAFAGVGIFPPTLGSWIGAPVDLPHLPIY
jgi:hypothetical protein